MRRAIGPILTTGVALAAAGVVVANPIIAPRADVQIPAVQLSADTGDAAAMLDQSFLDAIAPAPPESTNPFSVLRQLISSLAADASYIGKNAIVDAFMAGMTAVSQPELTASSAPFAAPSFLPPVSSPELVASVLPGLDLDALGQFPPVSANLPDASASAAGAAVAPVVNILVSSVVNDAGFVGGQLFAAAFAAGAVVAAEPGLISDTLEALITGDLTGALQNAVKAVTVTLGPPVIILNALRAVVEKNLSSVAVALSEAVPAMTATAAVESDIPVTIAASPAPAQPAPGASATRNGRTATPVVVEPGERAEAVDAVAAVPAPAAVTAASTRARPDFTTDAGSAPAAETEGPPAGTTPRPSLRDAVEAVGQRIGAAVATATAGTAPDSGPKAGARSGRAGN